MVLLSQPRSPALQPRRAGEVPLASSEPPPGVPRAGPPWEGPRRGSELFQQSPGDLSASSEMSVTGSQVCFLVTDIIVLNFLHGCYQSVTDTLGNGAF